MTPGAVRPVHAADAAFTQFIASLWPEAQAAGVARATGDAETRGGGPEDKMSDRWLPGRAAGGLVTCSVRCGCCWGLGSAPRRSAPSRPPWVPFWPA